jgi:hypothetical protein
MRQTVKYLLILILLIICLSSPAFAQGDGFGVGVIFGEQTGLSIKNWTGDTTAIAVGAAWKLSGRSALNVHVDYLFHNFGIVQINPGRLPLYYGIGGRANLVEGSGSKDNDHEVGVRVPFGVAYIFDEPPLDIFFQLVPVFDFTPSTGFDLNGGIGIRYFF